MLEHFQIPELKEIFFTVLCMRDFNNVGRNTQHWNYRTVFIKKVFCYSKFGI